MTTLGSVKECSIAGFRIETQADGDVKIKIPGIVTTTVVCGSGNTYRSGEFKIGKVTIPCVLNLANVRVLKEKIATTPDQGFPCTLSLMTGEIWGFDGSIDGDMEVSLKEGKVDLEFTASNLRQIG